MEFSGLIELEIAIFSKYCVKKNCAIMYHSCVTVINMQQTCNTTEIRYRKYNIENEFCSIEVYPIQ